MKWLAFLVFASCAPAAAAQTCDGSLWQHVYHPQRLKILQPCLAVTGTLEDATNGRKRDGVRHEADGDTHGWLKVDPEFENLLNAGNRNFEAGHLVFEIVCKYRVKQRDARPACKNFRAAVKLPAVGCRVRITGAYVQDQEHAQWNELHPVSSIEVLSCP